MIILSKDGSLDLHQQSPELHTAALGLGWDVQSEKAAAMAKMFGGTPTDYDLDAVAFVLNRSGKLLGDQWFVFFNNKSSPSGAVVSGGDNRTGEGDGDDETITVQFDRLPAMAESVVFWVTLYKAGERRQSLAEVENAYVRLVNQADGSEVLRFTITDQLPSGSAAMEVCKLTRSPSGTGWTFHAVGQGHPIEIGEVLARYK